MANLMLLFHLCPLPGTFGRFGWRQNARGEVMRIQSAMAICRLGCNARARKELGEYGFILPLIMMWKVDRLKRKRRLQRRCQRSWFIKGIKGFTGWKREV
ncbi:hypothetical protein M8C21_001858 [Ambrosia artemisiifolia]|uniref:Uncharacterized protein n=1 Tax=Ambrosia artemisiifolia TaxID=4212 RepID=A0AAD5CW84_AMBAR|nr:hypothetical protein M8C21_001858 [Ambrosia artemisiifolia]